MSKAESTHEERRTARRYRVPGSARVFWDGESAPVLIADVSSGGCLLSGEQLPPVGKRVFLSLDIGGLPNVRLPAVTIRRNEENGVPVAALRFEVPSASTGGLDRLLGQHVHHDSVGLSVLVIDRDQRSRERIERAVSETGARVLATESAERALRQVRELRANVVLARADIEGLAALSALSRECPTAFRVAFGRKSAIESALSMGIAQAAADDPCSAKCLGELLKRRPSRTPS